MTLPSGTYTIHPSASPLLAAGGLYAVPEDASLNTEQAQSIDLSYSPKSSYDISLTDIQAAKDAAIASGMSEDDVSNLSTNLDKMGTLAAYMPIFKDMQALDSGGVQSGMVNIAAKDISADYPVAKLEDLNSDGVPELLVGVAGEAYDFSLDVCVTQIFGIKDGKAELLTGLKPGGSNAVEGQLLIATLNIPGYEGLCFYTFNTPDHIATIRKFNDNGEIVDVLYINDSTDFNGYDVVTTDGQVVDKIDARDIGLYRANKFSERKEKDYEMYGGYMIRLNALAHGVDLGPDSTQYFDADSLSGNFGISNPSSAITVDQNNKQIHVSGQAFVFDKSGSINQINVDFDCVYDDDTFFGTNYGSAPYFGKQYLGVDGYLQSPGSGSFINMKNGYLIALFATS